MFITFQKGGLKWTDGSPYVYRDWLIPGAMALPESRHDCYSIGYMLHYSVCLQIGTRNLLFNDVMSHLQPFTNNNTRLCVGLLHQGEASGWVMIPCDTTISLAARICETPFEAVVEQNASHHDTTDESHKYTALNNYTLYTWDEKREMYIYDRLNISAEKNPFIYQADHEYESYVYSDNIQTIHPFIGMEGRRCKSRWIFISGSCFQLWNLPNDDSDRSALQACSHQISSDILPSISDTLVTYLTQWMHYDEQILMRASTSAAQIWCHVLLFRKTLGTEYEIVIAQPHVSCTSVHVSYMLCIEHSQRKPPSCPNGTFTCQDGTCINGEHQCDGFPDCFDGDDESDKQCSFLYTSDTTAVHNYRFVCSTGELVSYSLVCVFE